MRVYEPPASRFAGRVPLLLTQKGEVAVASRFPGSSGWTLHSLGSRLRGNDGGFAGMTGVRARNDVSCAKVPRWERDGAFPGLRVHRTHLARKRYKQKCILRAVSSLSATDRIYAEMI